VRGGAGWKDDDDDDLIGRLMRDEPSCPIDDRDKETDIVKRAIHETFWVRPEWGS